nr:methyl-CpG-binding domain-containing protein 8-like [Ipomoea batatas]
MWRLALCGVNSTAIVNIYLHPEMHGEEILREGKIIRRGGVQIYDSTAIVTYIAPEMHGEEILREGTDNPAGGVQIYDRKTRSGGYWNWRPLTDGMIMKDGKYGCQFCPKVFDRLTSYTGHVGIHLRRNLKCSSTSIEAAPMAAHIYLL